MKLIQLKNVHTKQLRHLNIKQSGRSSDLISPTFVQGCFGKCSYCYAARHAPDKFYNQILVSKNTEEILDKIKNYDTSIITKPNQTHDKYITWDIACNADIVPVLDEINFKDISEYFINSERDFATFATKFVSKNLLSYEANRKIRVRMSLMPFEASKGLERNTANIKSRILFMNDLYKAGYEVHINFSPVIWYPGWEEDYKELFIYIDKNLNNEVKEELACEIILLTHNNKLHDYNIINKIPFEDVLWQPNMQENKTSMFGGENIRYELNIKRHLLTKFLSMLSNTLPYCKVRYAF